MVIPLNDMVTLLIFDFYLLKPFFLDKLFKEHWVFFYKVVLVYLIYFKKRLLSTDDISIIIMILKS